jgi:hypothetical protein
MVVELRALGQVEVLVDGVRVDLGYPRQRSAPAVLLVDANQVAPTTGADRSPPAPRQPPAAPGAFAGRAPEPAELHRVPTSGDPAVVITAIGGAGA